MAIIADALISIWSGLPAILVTLTLFHFTRNYFKPGVASVPGPLLAKITNLWRFIDVAHGRAEVKLYNLHQKYGDYVRLGPNVVSVQNLDALKTIYGINKGYQKVSPIHKNRSICLTSARQISIVFSNSLPKAKRCRPCSPQSMKIYMLRLKGPSHPLMQ
jgi:hypothetical protein